VKLTVMTDRNMEVRLAFIVSFKFYKYVIIGRSISTGKEVYMKQLYNNFYGTMQYNNTLPM
jgi:hypothetical protein